MSAFCVFGVTMNDCIERAKKKTKIYDKELKRALTREEWMARVDVLAKELFENGKYAKQISPEFDAPQFAMDWLDVAKRTIESHSTKLMCRGEKIDEKGNKVLRKGHPVIGWKKYEERKDA